MAKRTLPWELLGAVVGAGLASGREIASFFGRYGLAGFAGVLLASGALYLLGDAETPDGWHGRWPEKLWRMLRAALLVVTGGAMLAGAGEIAALTLPVRGAYGLGLAATGGLAWFLARRTQSGLAWVSRALMIVMAALIVLGGVLPPMRAARVTDDSMAMGGWMILRSIAYGGFNAALASPVLAASVESRGEKRRSLQKACMLLMILLLAGNTVLWRHPALLSEPLPFVRLMRQYGQVGYAVGAVSLYLAVLSTLTACLRGVKGLLPCAAMLLTALAGFTGVVDALYPLLGTGCAVMLASMRIVGKAHRKNR